MADGNEITISGGGSVAVGTDELFASAAALRRAEAELASELRELAAIDRLVGSGRLSGAPANAVLAERELDDAVASLNRAHTATSHLGTALDLSADAYGLAERATRSLAEAAAARLAYTLGLVAPAAIAEVAPVVLGLAAVAGVVVLIMPPEARTALGHTITDWLKKHKAVLNDPGFTEMVRLTVMSIDEFGAGLLHLPVLNGHDGVPTSVATVMAIGGVGGLMRETPVWTLMTSRDTAATPVPDGWEDRAGRVPQKGDSEAQVRIDTYLMPDGSKRYEVYIGGTRDFALGGDDQPWDMTSNLTGIEGGESGSMRAVENAMRDAGITKDSPVLITGHSQGGLVAARLAGSGEYNVQGLFTLGAPAAQTTVPSSIPWIALEHSNDIVPALSGSWTHSDPVIVTREVTAAEIENSSKWFPSHELPAYEQTAAMVDTASDARVERVATVFDEFTDGATPVLTETFWSGRETED